MTRSQLVEKKPRKNTRFQRVVWLRCSSSHVGESLSLIEQNPRLNSIDWFLADKPPPICRGRRTSQYTPARSNAGTTIGMSRQLAISHMMTSWYVTCLPFTRHSRPLERWTWKIANPGRFCAVSTKY
jgi:hypothetical protein